MKNGVIKTNQIIDSVPSSATMENARVKAQNLLDNGVAENERNDPNFKLTFTQECEISQDGKAIETIYEYQRTTNDGSVRKFLCIERFLLFTHEGKMVRLTTTKDITGISEEEKEQVANNLSNGMNTFVATAFQAISLGGSITGGRNPVGIFEDVLENIGLYKPSDMDVDTANKIEGKTGIILTTITDIGMVVAVLILAILGIKYMLGSAEEKAEYKKDLIPYLIGAALLFGITMFVKAFMLWGDQISNI